MDWDHIIAAAGTLFLVLVLLLFFFFLGKSILGWMGITASSLNISGGIMLFLIAVGMVFPTRRSPHLNLSSSELFIVPVSVPLIVGPAAISLVMMQAALSTDLLSRLEGVLSILLAWGPAALLLYFSDCLLNLLGEKGTTALTRLMGTILVLLAVQMVLNGVTEYIVSLPGFGTR